jgi:hypothetical protein
VSPGAVRIEVVRGQTSAERAEEILGFLSREAGLEGEAARRRLSDVVCVARDGGAIVAVNAVHPQEISLVGGRTFWIYRSSLDGDYGERWTEMFKAAFEALSEEFEPSGTGPLGLCVIVSDRDEIARRPEAIWRDSELMFAGWLDDDRQVRIRYFWDAAIGPGVPDSPGLDELKDREFPLEDACRIEPLTEASEVTAEDVLRLWARERAMPAEEAGLRVHEARLVATERDEGVIGVSTVRLQRNPQLRMDVWWYRTYVAEAHRKSNLAFQLLVGNRDLLEERYVSGEDPRAAGIVFELENEGLKRYANRALWLPPDFTFIGENQRGGHVRVHYFSGARVAVPDGRDRPS